MQTAHAEAGDDPAVEPIGETRNGFVRDGDQAGVNLVEIETVAHGTGKEAELLGQRIFLGVRVDAIGQGEPKDGRAQPDQCRERRVAEGSKHGFEEVPVMNGGFRRELATEEQINAPEAGQHGGHGENDQRPGHDLRRFMRVVGVFRTVRAEERHENQPRHVERGEQRDQGGDDEEEHAVFRSRRED